MRSESSVHSELAERFHRGEEGALAQVVREFHRPMLKVAHSLLGEWELAGEAVQQAFIQAWRAASTFDPAMPLSPWLYAIVRRTAIDVHRRGKRFAAALPLDAVTDDTVSADPPSLDEIWTKGEVQRAIDRLPVEEAQIVLLAYYVGLSHREISSRVAIPLGTVKSRSVRAHRRLAGLLAHLAADPPLAS